MRTHTTLWIVLATVVIAGCEEDVAGVLGTPQAFSLYGVLQPAADTQFVRVFPIAGRLARDTSRTLGARFTATELETGASFVWRDSTIVDGDGDAAHFFFAPFRPAYGRTYRLEVVETGDAARRTHVDVEVPPRSDLSRGDPTGRVTVLVPLYVDGGVPRLLQPEVTFSVAFADGVSPTGLPTLKHLNLTFPYDAQVLRRPERWVIPVNLTEAYHEALRRALQSSNFQSAFGVSLVEVQVRLIAANEAWDPPGAVFDPLILAQPGLMSNVENGFGFVGAGYRLETHWVPDDATVAAAGFRPL